MELNGLWWIYPIATWLGGAIAGIAKHVIQDAQDSLKESDEYRDSLMADKNFKGSFSSKVNLDKSSEELDGSDDMNLNRSHFD